VTKIAFVLEKNGEGRKGERRMPPRNFFTILLDAVIEGVIF
jgi:hypothetical protein